MNKDTIIRVVSIVGALGIVYFLYKKITKGSDVMDTDVSPNETTTQTETTESGFEKYKVTTKDTSLNIREKADAKSKRIGKLDKGQEVLLKPSSTSGWMEYSTNGITTFGFVSTQYVTKA